MHPRARLAWLASLPIVACGAPQRSEGVQDDSYLAHVAAADASLRLGELANFRRWLERAPVAERGFEWRWLDARRDQSLETRELRVGPLTTLDVDPTGATVAVGAADGTIVVLERGGRELWRAKPHAQGVSCVRFDPAGARIVSASRDTTVKVLDARSGAELATLRRHGFPVAAAAFSPDGTRIASCSYERMPTCVVGTVHLWSAASGEWLATLEGGTAPLSSIAFSAGGERLAAGSWDGCAFLWDVGGSGAPRELAVPDEGKHRAVDAIAFSSDGLRLAVASKDDTARVFEIESGLLVASLRGHSNHVTAVAFAPDGRTIATASADETIRLWSAEGEPLEVARGHVEGIRALRFAPDGQRLVSAGADGVLREWHATTRAYDWIDLRTSAAAYSAVFSPDGTRLASCGYDGRVQLWSTATWTELASWQAHPRKSSCHMLAFSPDSARLYSGSYDKTLAVWDAVTLEELGRLTHEVGLYTARSSPDGRVLAVAQTDGVVWLWDATRGSKLGSIAPGLGTVNDLAFSPSGESLAIAASTSEVGVWSVATRERVAALDHAPSRTTSCVFSADGSALITGDQAGLVRAWRVDGWSCERTVACYNDPVTRLAPSPDGSRVAATSREVALVDWRRGELAATMRPHVEATFHVDWSPDGHSIATAAMDATLAIADDRPLAARLAAADRARGLLSRSNEWLAAELAGGSDLASLRDAILGDRALERDLRDARLAAITTRAGATAE